jgi:hypothetical protein
VPIGAQRDGERGALGPGLGKPAAPASNVRGRPAASARPSSGGGVLPLNRSVSQRGMPDPRLVARSFPALHVLLQTDGEHDEPLAAHLARLGHGRMATHRDVAPALNRILAG